MHVLIAVRNAVTQSVMFRGDSVESSVAGAIIEANVWSMAFASCLLFLAAEMLVLFRQECV